MEQAVGALIGRGHAGDVVDPGVGQHVPLIDLGGVAHQTEDIVVLAGDEGNVQTLLLEFVNDLFQFSFGVPFLVEMIIVNLRPSFISFSRSLVHHDMRLAAVGAQQLGQIDAGVQIAAAALPIKWP